MPDLQIKVTLDVDLCTGISTRGDGYHGNVERDTGQLDQMNASLLLALAIVIP